MAPDQLTGYPAVQLFWFSLPFAASLLSVTIISYAYRLPVLTSYPPNSMIMALINDKYLQDCFEGKKLYGDDFTHQQMAEWYKLEKEGYADLYAEEGVETVYPYDAINTFHCYQHTGERVFDQVLSIGGSYCQELLPIVDRIRHITVLEPSDQLTAEFLEGIPLHYVKPCITGKIPFADHSFDLITCFGVLHHIPNVSFVLAEIERVLKPGGLFLFREPIVSMGDWTRDRPGLTRNERGIPKPFLDKLIRRLKFKVVNYSLCFTRPFDMLTANIFNINVYGSPRFVRIDKILGGLFRLNYVYHPKTILQKIRPSCVAGVLKKAA